MLKSESPAGAGQTALNVFISYSRKDVDFARRLVGALERRGLTAKIDERDLPALEDWKRELLGFIRSADTVIFVVSSNSIASSVCEWEIEQVAALNKRLAPVVLERVADDKVPGEIARINYLFFDFPNNFDAQADKLVAALLTDADWLREHTRLCTLADRWMGGGKGNAQLLRSEEIDYAAGWAEKRPRNAPEIPESLTEYLAAGRVFEQQARDRLRRIVGRAFVKPAQQALSDMRGDHALRLAAAGALLADDVSFELVPELWPVAWQAIRDNHLVGDVSAADLDPRKRHWISRGSDGVNRVVERSTGRQCATLNEAGTDVHCVEFSSDESMVAWSSSDKKIEIFDLRRDALTGILDLPDEADIDVAEARFMFRSDATLYVVICKTGKEVPKEERNTQITWWDVKQAPVFLGKHVLWGAETADPINVDVSPDGDTLLVGSFGGTYLVGLQEQRDKTRLFDAYFGLGLIAPRFNRDGTGVLTKGKDNTLVVWSAAGGERLATFDQKRFIHSACFSDDGGCVVSCDDNNAIIWDTEDAKPFRSYRISTGANSGDTARGAQFSSGGRSVLAYSDNRWRKWTAERDLAFAHLRGHSASLRSAVFSPDGLRVATISQDHTARVWNVGDGRPLCVFRKHSNWLRSATFASDSDLVATTSDDATVCVWDPETGKEVAVLTGHTGPVEHAVFGSDSRSILSGGSDGTCRVWDVQTNRELRRFVGHTGRIKTIAVSPNGSVILTAGVDRTARIWSAMDGVEIATLQGHSAPLRSAIFSPDGHLVVTASHDKVVCVWDWRSNQVVRKFTDHTDVVATIAFSPNGKLVMSCDLRGNVFTWLPGGGAPIARMKGEGPSAMFSSDGMRVVTAAPNGAKIWDVDTGFECANLQGHASSVRSVAFDPDGRNVITASEDNTAMLWDVSRTVALPSSRSILLASALASGAGIRTSDEVADLLMQDAPEDLFAVALAKLGKTKSDPDISKLTETLFAHLHPNCYLSPTQFQRKFAAPSEGTQPVSS